MASSSSVAIWVGYIIRQCRARIGVAVVVMDITTVGVIIVAVVPRVCVI
ncbi:MAG: hypothetical protein QF463_11990 [Vicinamibacterales bacterium]|nr:hypothetical protein [Vicinamibacterales bacterium]MDP6609780.1 hypothetical protein [Vicinamibacterales bacterium]|tara:strand:+ start:2418 stop:2564 length:147 start_codon:yes stop_codon:yes gene_type:complete